MKSVFVLVSLLAIAAAVHGESALEKGVHEATKKAVEDIQNGKGVLERVEAAIPQLQQIAVKCAESFGKNGDPKLREGVAYVRAVVGSLRANAQAIISLCNDPYKQGSIEILKFIMDTQEPILFNLQKVVEEQTEAGAPEGFEIAVQQLVKDFERDLYIFLPKVNEIIINGNLTLEAIVPIVTLLTGYSIRYIELATVAI